MTDILIRDRRHSPVYEVSRGLSWLALHILYRPHVVGQEHIPLSGPVILGSNHIHNFDPLLIGAHCPRYIHFMSKEEMFKGPLLSWFLGMVGAFPIRRGRGDKKAIRHALAVPAANQCLLVFPEGHRSKDGKIGSGMPGIALIARKSSCPVIPTVVVGTYGFRKKLTVCFGEPILPKPDDTNETFMETLMERIRALQRQVQLS